MGELEKGIEEIFELFMIILEELTLVISFSIPGIDVCLSFGFSVDIFDVSVFLDVSSSLLSLDVLLLSVVSSFSSFEVLDKSLFDITDSSFISDSPIFGFSVSSLVSVSLVFLIPFYDLLLFLHYFLILLHH